MFRIATVDINIRLLIKKMSSYPEQPLKNTATDYQFLCHPILTDVTLTGFKIVVP